MKTLVLDGAPAGGTPLDRVGAALRGALEIGGCAVRTLTLRKMRIRPCRGCFECWVGSPGECVIDDDGREVCREVVAASLVVYLTPVVFGGYGSELKKAIDRFACPILLPFFTRIGGEVHHPRRYRRAHRLLAVGLLEDGDPEAAEIFAALVGRNALNHHAAASAAVVLGPEAGDGEIAERVRRFLEAGK